jgi:release factor glutamine methyltransferase
MSAVALPSSLAIADQIAWAIDAIEPVTDTARLEAELLLAESAGIRRAAVLAHPERELSPEQASRLEKTVVRRSRGEPLAYIVGRREFYSLNLSVGPEVLVPRPETEALVDAVLERLSANVERVVDLGTGSGAIALALKHERRGLQVTAVDCDRAALNVARSNAAALGLAIEWVRSDWFAALAGRQFDVIVSNPPYVASGGLNFDRALAHEPRIALDGGTDGLDAYRAILRDAKAHLAPGGWLIVEHGFDQRDAVSELADAFGYSFFEPVDDLAGLPRIACLKER